MRTPGFIRHLASCVDTTRPPKKNEEDGKEYHFISAEEMARSISANAFLEFGSYQGNMFGTKFETVHQIHEQDKIAILDIEPQVGRPGKAGTDEVWCTWFWWNSLKPEQLNREGWE